MNKQQVIKAMAVAGIVGRVAGKGEDWEVVFDGVGALLATEAFVEKVAKVAAVKCGSAGWTVRPMKQAGLLFGTLDSAQQGSLFG